jgi:hypothetical protein
MGKLKKANLISMVITVDRKRTYSQRSLTSWILNIPNRSVNYLRIKRSCRHWNSGNRSIDVNLHDPLIRML